MLVIPHCERILLLVVEAATIFMQDVISLGIFGRVQLKEIVATNFDCGDQQLVFAVVNYAASVVGKHLVNGYPLICTGTGQCSLILCVCHGSFSQLLPGQAFI